jgi:hypothetical protein
MRRLLVHATIAAPLMPGLVSAGPIVDAGWRLRWSLDLAAAPRVDRTSPKAAVRRRGRIRFDVVDGISQGAVRMDAASRLMSLRRRAWRGSTVR